MGEVQKQLFKVLASSPDVSTQAFKKASSTFAECCEEKYVYADLSNDRNEYNDFNSFLKYFSDSISSVDIYIQKCISGVWTDLDQIIDDSLGDFFPYKYQISDGENYVGALIKWRNILQTYSTGKYRLRFETTNIFSDVSSLYTDAYSLREYDAELVDGTVKIDYTMTGMCPDFETTDKRKYFGKTGWINSIRLNGYFGYEKANYGQEVVEYANRSKINVITDETKEYRLQTYDLDKSTHNQLMDELMNADIVTISDYNRDNFGNYVNIQLVPTGAYEPKYNELQSKKAMVVLAFNNGINNLEKRWQ